MSRKWTREHFVDHPRFIKRQVAANRPPEVWANASKDKIKLICRYCLEANIGNIIQEEETMRLSNENFQVRSRDVITLGCK